MQEYLKTLNPEQLDAVTYGVTADSIIGGPLLIIAGAGSGKTNTLAYRVAHLINSGADPQKIALLTFTRRAAEEMTRRATKILVLAQKAAENSDKPKPSITATLSWAGTFHSIANRLLRMYADQIGLDQSFTVLDRSDAGDLMNKLRHDLGFAKTNARFPKKDTCLDIYSYSVNAQCTLDNALKDVYPWCYAWEKELKVLFKKYADTKKAMNIMDYDDLLLYWYFMMQQPSIAISVGKRFDHILIDEYQDTNTLQAGIVKGIKPDGMGVTVVGDDAQSIYSFRSASVKNILEFDTHYSPHAHRVTLEKNYRSTVPILDASNAVMGAAKHRFTKNLFSEKQSFEKPYLTTTEDESFQAEHVAIKILEYRETGIPLKDQAVLFRSSHHSALLEVELGKRNIPFIKFGGLKFLESAHIKDVVSALRWAENPKDAIASFRVLQILEGIGPAAAMKILSFLESHSFDVAMLITLVPPSATQNSWPALCKLLALLRNAATPWIGQVELVRQWYAPHLERIHGANPSRLKDLDQLVAISATFPTREKFLSELSLNPPDVTSDEADDPLLDEDYLILSTIHSAKGQEWKTVFILNVCDGMIPSDMATKNEEQIEEERRLLYVAMTRAKDHLHLSYPSRFYSYGFKHVRADRNAYAIRSRFITNEMLPFFNQDSYGREVNQDIQDAQGGKSSVDISALVSGMWD